MIQKEIIFEKQLTFSTTKDTKFFSFNLQKYAK